MTFFRLEDHQTVPCVMMGCDLPWINVVTILQAARWDRRSPSLWLAVVKVLDLPKLEQPKLEVTLSGEN